MGPLLHSAAAAAAEDCKRKGTTALAAGARATAEGKDCSFEAEPAHKVVSLSPKRGRVFYFNDRAAALGGKPVTGLPSEEEVLARSLELAKKLGIKPSEFARKPDSDAFLCWRDRRTQKGKVDGKLTNRESARGIFLYRVIDGVSFEGTGICGGLYVNFGNEARIAQLDLSWRNLEVKKRCRVADREQLTSWIKGGKAVIQMAEPEIGKVRKLVILDVVPHYRAYSSEVEQSSVFPFVLIQATVETEDAKLPVALLSPIVKDE